MTEDLPRPLVPAPVAVVRDFVNTTDLESGSDDLATPAALAAYLLAEGLLDREVRATGADLAAAHRLRAGLRTALEFNHAGAAASLPELRAALRDLPVGLDWTGPDGEGVTLRVTAGGVAGGLARIGLAAHACSVQGIWGRLKICFSDDCAWAYYDGSKNRSRTWCEYGCGNKIKTRAYRARQRAARSPGG